MPGPERPLGTSTVSEIEETVNNSIPQLQSQGGPILLMAYLHREMSHLPSAAFSMLSHTPDKLDIHLHAALADELPALTAFEAWRVALGLGTPTPHHTQGYSWAEVAGVVDDVRVVLHGFGTAADVDALVAVLASTAVAA